jgi:hypothetical protein
MPPSDVLAVELRLDRIEAALAAELPGHVRGFAHAHARGAPPPPAPEVLRRPGTLATARAALAHPGLADRGLAVLRLTAPLAIEADAGVIAARAARPSWDALAALVRARDAASVARFGRRALELVHRLDGVDPGDGGDPEQGALAPPDPAWSAPDGIVIDAAAIERAWHGLSSRHGVVGTVRFVPGDGVKPRTFVVEPGREVVVVLPTQRATPAARFAVLHELGHAVAALALPAGIPRVVDEAAAAYVARAVERDDAGDGVTAWASTTAQAARRRRGGLAARLARIEHGLPELTERLTPAPPWALWHDPGAQAAYVAAEVMADALAGMLGAAPAPGALAEALRAQRASIDRGAAGL